MGLFDSIRGEVACPKCGKTVAVEIQFKWGNCLLNDYYVGERIEPHHSGVMWETNDWCPDHCPHCNKKVVVYARLVDGWVEGLYLKKSDASKTPQVPKESFRETLYRRAVEAMEGNCREHLSFKKQPYPIGGTFTAFGKKWTVTERWTEDAITDNAWSTFAGSFARKSTKRYVYRIMCGDVQRWALVTDHEKGFGGYYGGNVSLFLDQPEVRHGYERTKIDA